MTGPIKFLQTPAVGRVPIYTTLSDTFTLHFSQMRRRDTVEEPQLPPGHTGTLKQGSCIGPQDEDRKPTISTNWHKKANFIQPEVLAAYIGPKYARFALKSRN